MLLLEALIKKLCVSPWWFHLTEYLRISLMSGVYHLISDFPMILVSDSSNFCLPNQYCILTFKNQKRPSPFGTPFPKSKCQFVCYWSRDQLLLIICCIYTYIYIYLFNYIGNERLLPSYEIDFQNTPFNKDPGTWPNHFIFLFFVIVLRILPW